MTVTEQSWAVFDLFGVVFLVLGATAVALSFRIMRKVSRLTEGMADRRTLVDQLTFHQPAGPRCCSCGWVAKDDTLTDARAIADHQAQALLVFTHARGVAA